MRYFIIVALLCLFLGMSVTMIAQQFLLPQNTFNKPALFTSPVPKKPHPKTTTEPLTSLESIKKGNLIPLKLKPQFNQIILYPDNTLVCTLPASDKPSGSRAIAVIDETLYYLNKGQIFTLSLGELIETEKPLSAQVLPAPVKDIIAMTASQDRHFLYVIAKSNALYQYSVSNTTANRWKQLFTSTNSSHYRAVVSWKERTYFLDNLGKQIKRYEAEQSELTPVLSHVITSEHKTGVDLYIDGKIYVL